MACMIKKGKEKTKIYNVLMAFKMPISQKHKGRPEISAAITRVTLRRANVAMRATFLFSVQC